MTDNETRQDNSKKKISDNNKHPKRQKMKNQRNTKTIQKVRDYTTITDRLRTVSWSDNGLPTGFVNLSFLKGPNFPLPETVVISKETSIYITSGCFDTFFSTRTNKVSSSNIVIIHLFLKLS